MTRIKNRKAFTLIELVVVIVIIAILAAIAAFAYNSVINNSKKSAIEATAQQVNKSYQAAVAAGGAAAGAGTGSVVNAIQDLTANSAATIPGTTGVITANGYTYSVNSVTVPSFMSIGKDGKCTVVTFTAPGQAASYATNAGNAVAATAIGTCG